MSKTLVIMSIDLYSAIDYNKIKTDQTEGNNMTTEINVNELLNKAYEKMFNDAMEKRYQTMTMKESNLKFRIYEGYGYATYKWELQFEKFIDFDRSSYNSFTFKTDLELGKFLFECGANGGLPKGAKGVLN